MLHAHVCVFLNKCVKKMLHSVQSNWTFIALIEHLTRKNKMAQSSRNRLITSLLANNAKKFVKKYKILLNAICYVQSISS